MHLHLPIEQLVRREGTPFQFAFATEAKGLLPEGGEFLLNASQKGLHVLARNEEALGTPLEAIRMAEDRELFRVAMGEIGLECPKAEVARTFEQAVEIQAKVGSPTIIRPSFTLGGTGGGIAYNREEYEAIRAHRRVGRRDASLDLPRQGGQAAEEGAAGDLLPQRDQAARHAQPDRGTDRRRRLVVGICPHACRKSSGFGPAFDA